MKYLTGIKPTGDVHLGNYVSVIQPLMNLIKSEPNSSFYCFIADGHSLTTHQRSNHLKDSILNIAATWFSCGFDKENAFIYRQSQIPEIFQIFWILSCFTAKGYLNRCHAYHSLVEENKEKGKNPDHGIFTGLYNYPVLMAADILTFDIHGVPIGKDQRQHLEITKEVARKFNHVYKTKELRMPDELYLNGIELPGKDGRKMSKSYNNHIPLFCREPYLRWHIFSIPTNSKMEGQIKYPNESNVTTLFKCMTGSNNSEVDTVDQMCHNGEGWGNIKQYIFESIDKELKDKRDTYHYLMNNKIKIVNKLIENEKIIRKQAQEKLNNLKEIIGLQ